MQHKAEGLHVEINGREWTTDRLNPVIFEPRPAALGVSSLSGFSEYIAANRDSVNLEKAIVIIEDVDKVVLASELGGEKLERSYFIRAEVDKKLKGYPFDQFMSVEAFVVALRSLFEATTDRDDVLSYVSKVSGGSSFTLDDDGISQNVAVKAGVSGAMMANETTRGIVRLRPYRTFRDIEQPESEFLLRMKLIDTEKQTVGVTIFEADGGRWRNQAINTIAQYLRDKLPANLAIVG